MVIGSRSAERADGTAETLAGATGGQVTGADNKGAAEAGDIVVVAVPWDGHGDLLRDLASALAGKIVVDCVNPLGFDKKGGYALPVEGDRPHSRPSRCSRTAPWWPRSTTSAR